MLKADYTPVLTPLDEVVFTQSDTTRKAGGLMSGVA